MKYNLDNIIKDFIPFFYQNEENFSLIDTILHGCFDTVNEKLETTENETKIQLGYSIQRLSLENSLNNVFDSVLKRIIIDNSSNVVINPYVFNSGETAPQKTFLGNKGEGGLDKVYTFNSTEQKPLSSVIRFTVFVPIEYQNIENKIKNHINLVQIYGTGYDIIYF